MRPIARLLALGCLPALWLFMGTGFLSSQQISKEYIRLGGRVIAVENPAAPSIVLNPTQAQVAAAGQSGSFAVTTTASWTAEPNAAWLTVTNPCSPQCSGNGTVNWTAQPNSGAARNANIVVGTAQFSVSQSGATAGFTFVSNDPLTLSSNAGTGTATITSNLPSTPWHVASNATWLSVTSAADGAGSGSVNYSYTANTGANAVTRNATLTLSSTVGGISPIDIPFVQPPNQGGSNSLTISSSEPLTTLHSRAHSVLVTVSTNAAGWSASRGSFSWISLNSVGGATATGTNGQAFTVILAPNNSNADLNGTITITAGSAASQVSVVQKKAQTLTIVPDVPSIQVTVLSTFQFHVQIDGIEDPSAPVAWATDTYPLTSITSPGGLFTASSSQTFSQVMATFSGVAPALTDSIQVESTPVSYTPPSPISVTPAAGTGTGASFSTVVTSPYGASAINKVLWTYDSAGIQWDCSPSVFPQDFPPTMWLYFGGAQLASPPFRGMGQPPDMVGGTVCSLNSQSSSQTMSGQTLTATTPISFASAVGGEREILVRGESNAYGTIYSSPWVPLGTYTVAQGPTVSLVNPTAGTGASTVLTADYGFVDGISGLNVVELLVGGGASSTSSCLVRYKVGPQTFHLLSDSGTEGTGYQAGTNQVLQNSQCSLSLQGASATAVSGQMLRLVLPVSFKIAYAGLKLTYLRSVTNTSIDTGYLSKGTWTVDEPPVGLPVSPASGSGQSGSFVFTFSDLNGFADITEMYGLIGPDPTTGCAVKYTANGNTLSLVGTSGSITPGSGSLSNGRCTVAGGQSAVGSTATTRILTASITFNPGFTGTKNFYLWAKDAAGLETLSGVLGTWNIAQPAPAVSTTNPSNGSSDVATNTSVSATFTLPVNGSSITSSSFTLTPGGGSPIQANVTFPNGIAMLTPTNPLQASTTYTARLTTAVTGTNGVTLANDYTWSFTTAAPSGGANSSTVAAPVSTSLPNNVACPGQTFTATVQMTNNGTLPWAAGSYQLAAVQAIWGTNTLVLPASVAVGATGTFNVTVTAPTAANTYDFAWRLKDGSGTAFGATASVSLSVPSMSVAGNLPAGWNHEDIGAVLQPGCATQNGGTFQVTSAGHLDYWATPDTFHFAYKQVGTNSSITAHITSVSPENTSGNFTFAGVMIRENLGAPIAQMMMAGRVHNQNPLNATVTRPGNLDRYVDGGQTVMALPAWVKLTRTGNTVVAEESANGSNWSIIRTTTFTNLPANVYMGLMAVNVDGGIATFDNVTVTGAAGDITPPVISNVTVTPSTTGATISWNTDEGSDTQIYYGTTPSYGNSTNLDTTLQTSHSQSISGLSSSTTYYYEVRSRNEAGLLSTATGSFTTSAGSNCTISGNLPSGWSHQDVGSVIQAGCATQNGGTYQVFSAGHLDYWATPDTFHFAYKQVGTNSSITAHITSVSPGNTSGNFTFAGVMIRENLGAPIVQMMMAGRVHNQNPLNATVTRPGNLDRYVDGGQTVMALPAWVRLTRTGNTVVAEESADGSTWITIRTTTFTNLPANVYMGLMAVNVDGGIATFDNVTVTGAQ